MTATNSPLSVNIWEDFFNVMGYDIVMHIAKEC